MNVLLGIFSGGDIYISEIDKKIAVLGQDNARVMLRRLSCARKLTKLMSLDVAGRCEACPRHGNCKRKTHGSWITPALSQQER